MSTPTITQPVTDEETTQPVAIDSDDPFNFDIGFIEGTPASESILMCSTGDTCGSSCPSACTTS